MAVNDREPTIQIRCPNCGRLHYDLNYVRCVECGGQL